MIPQFLLSRISPVLLGLLGILLMQGCFPASQEASPPVHHSSQVRTPSLQTIIQQRRIPQDSLSILISKPDYELQVLAEGEILKTYPVVFGGNAVADKRMQGDQCTPEGIFRIRDLYPHAKWSYFLWIDYPTEESWQRHQEAKTMGLIPEDAKIGGDIGIHGVPLGYDHAIDQRQNWTLGCISLKNAHIQELYEAVKVGTVVEIVGVGE